MVWNIGPYFFEDGNGQTVTVTSRFGDVEWPARSPDLSPLDYFLWGYLKGKVYRNKPININQLKAAIEEEIQSSGQEMLTMNKIRHRAEICVRSGGQHFKDIKRK